MLDNLTPIDSRRQFDREVLGAQRPAFVVYFAPWCPHCRNLAGLLEHLAEQYAEHIAFWRLDLDDRGEIADQQGVRAVPAVQLIEGGQVRQQWLGEQDQSTYQEALDAALAGKT